MRIFDLAIRIIKVSHTPMTKTGQLIFLGFCVFIGPLACCCRTGPAGAVGDPAPPRSAAEQEARARWYDFELAPQIARYQGNWETLLAQYPAEDARLTEALRAAERSRARGPGNLTGDQARARRMLRLEFDDVQKNQRDAIWAAARRFLKLLAAGDIEQLVDETARYSATTPKRQELTRAYLAEHRDAFQKAARLVDPAAEHIDFSADFRGPNPDTGMVGTVEISFGPAAERPRQAPPSSYPRRHVLVIEWSGQVMPENNCPLWSHPGPGRLSTGHWHFRELVLPYSLSGEHELLPL
jgi:hypothetical protein